MKIRVKDKVKILSGKDRGKTGLVVKALPLKNTVVVEGVHIVKKHVKAGAVKGGKGGIISLEKPIDASSVMLICPKCEKASRVGFKVAGGKKYRRCVKCKGTF